MLIVSDSFLSLCSEMYSFRLPSSAFPANLLRPINHWKHNGMWIHYVHLTTLVLFSYSFFSGILLPFHIFSLYFSHLYYPSFHSNLYPFKIIEELGAQILGRWISTLLPVSSTECNSKFWAESLEQQPKNLEKYMIAGLLEEIRISEIKSSQDQWCIYDSPPFCFLCHSIRNKRSPKSINA